MNVTQWMQHATIAEAAPNPIAVVWHALATSPDPRVRAFLAEDPRTPRQVWQWLSVDLNRNVRCAAARSPQANAEDLLVLRGDPDVLVSRAATRDPDPNYLMPAMVVRV